MTAAVFGKAFTRKFIPHDGENYLVLPTQTPHIYIYDSQPDYAAASAGTGAVQTISTWSQYTTEPEVTYSVSAIEDPDPSSTISEREYWEAINYILETSGEIQTKIRMFTISRAGALDDSPNATREDIKALVPQITSYIQSDAELDSYLAIAEDLLKIHYEGKGYKWSQLSNLQSLKYAVAFKAIILHSTAQLTKPNGDKFAARIQTFKELLGEITANVMLDVDTNNDGKPDEQVEAQPQAAVIMR